MRRRVVNSSVTTCSPRANPRPATPRGRCKRMPKVLIVEDDYVIADGMSRHLRVAGFDPVWVGKGTTALARLRYERADVCVLDLMLPELDGWQIIEAARKEGIGT